MAEVLKTIIQVRRDTTANWEQHKDYIPEEGEPCLDLDTGIVKWGDGKTTYGELKGAGSQAAHYEGVKADGESDNDVIARVLTAGNVTPNKDDIFVVKALIADGKYAYTAFVYNGTAWAAMDGNYSAENVYFSEDMLFTYKFGKYEPDASGSVNIPAEGKSLKDLLMGAHVDIKDPTIKAPTLSINAGSDVTKEVGTTYSAPSATATFTDGTYTYGSVDADGNRITATGAGIVPTNITVTNNRTTDSVTTNGSTTAKSTINNNNFTDANSALKGLLVTDDSITYTFTATAEYPASVRTPVNNVGETSNSETGATYSPIAAGSFKDSTAKTDSVVINGFRPYFWGILDDTDALTSEKIRGLNKGSGSDAGNYNGKKTLTLSANGSTTAKRFVVAIPASSSRSGVSNVDSTAGMTVSVTAQYAKTDNAVKVADARGTVDGIDTNAVDYDVWVWQPASIDPGTVHVITLA